MQFTSAPGITYPELKKLNPCDESFRRVTKLLGGARKWNGNSITAKQAVEAGATLDDIMWAASRIAHENLDVERRLRLWMADCAAHVLHIFEAERPTDFRPRKAIEAARAFARGEIGDAARAAAGAAAGDAAKAAAGAAAGDARDAARDAAWAAAWAAEDAAWAAGAARAAAWAAEDAAWAAGAARAAARAAEEKWLFERLLLWLSAEEPEDWALPSVREVTDAA